MNSYYQNNSALLPLSCPTTCIACFVYSLVALDCDSKYGKVNIQYYLKINKGKNLFLLLVVLSETYFNGRSYFIGNLYCKISIILSFVLQDYKGSQMDKA